MPLLRPLYEDWFRVEVNGVENVPAERLRPARREPLRRTVAARRAMISVAVHDEHPAGRYLRLLGADLVFPRPVVGELARKTGATLACNRDAERLLDAGELVGVFPEGFKGIGKPYRDRYKLQRFGRGGFVPRRCAPVRRSSRSRSSAPRRSTRCSATSSRWPGCWACRTSR